MNSNNFISIGCLVALFTAIEHNNAHAQTPLFKKIKWEPTKRVYTYYSRRGNTETKIEPMEIEIEARKASGRIVYKLYISTRSSDLYCTSGGTMAEFGIVFEPGIPNIVNGKCDLGDVICIAYSAIVSESPSGKILHIKSQTNRDYKGSNFWTLNYKSAMDIKIEFNAEKQICRVLGYRWDYNYENKKENAISERIIEQNADSIAKCEIE